MTNPLANEFEYYLANQDEIVAEYEGKFVVIKNQKIIGAYDNELEAISETRKEHEPGTFLVQLVGPGDAEYTQTFHSRVAFT